ncbi:hypothetical protein [Halorarum halobium]|uniref:hypothetical protein n=1 Tax=Halorarum halobium TaxID=3075121 RepID=UPI0028AEA3DF|nr:hypothetical protein [Halobaculum sp. XH14]
MDVTRFGVLGTLLVALLALGSLVSLSLTGLSLGGVAITLAMLVAVVALAVAWGRHTAPRRWRTTYW